MKRNSLALLLHPFKNGLVARPLLKESIDRFFETLFVIQQRFPQFRYNLVLPGYLLECTDPLLMAQLRELCKKNFVELVCTGYTEPFLSLSPPDLSIRNVRKGKQVIDELTGKAPCGFLPPFSNWEPSLIADLRAMGFRYALLSNELFPVETRAACGYWVAEHAGSSIGLVGTNIVNNAASKPEFIEWISGLITGNSILVPNPFAVLHFLLPLFSDKTDEAYRFLHSSVEEIEKNLLTFQPACMSDLIGATSPAGLQYVPTSLQLGRKGTVDLHFLNYLFSFDQVGFIQRKMLDIYDRAASFPDQRVLPKLLDDFYFVQDINRFLPGRDSGFELHSDRQGTYARLISIDKKIHTLNKNEGGYVRITDFLRNGGKTIMLTNRILKACIDFRHGGQIIGMDFRPRLVNLCSVYNPVRHDQPDIIVPEVSRTWFLDRILPDTGNDPEDSSHLFRDSSDFHSGEFNYKIRKNPSGINVTLMRAGSFTSLERQYPLRIEKVFGLEKESATLFFVYQFNNPSLMTCKFIFSTELHLYLPGIVAGSARLTAGKTSYEKAGREILRLPMLTRWSIEDRSSGIRFQMQTQKPITLWCFQQPSPDEPAEGLHMILTTPVTLDPNSQYKLLGKIVCKAIKKSPEEPDAL